jgi:hypothetical protein
MNASFFISPTPILLSNFERLSDDDFRTLATFVVQMFSQPATLAVQILKVPHRNRTLDP